MLKTLASFVQAPAIDALAKQYGECLEGMTLDKKMLAIRAISGGLLNAVLYPDVDLDIEDQSVCLMERDYKVGDELHDALTALDGCDERQCLALLSALVAYAGEELQQLGR